MPTNPGKRTGASTGEPRHGENPKAGGFDQAELHAANGTRAIRVQVCTRPVPRGLQQQNRTRPVLPSHQRGEGLPFDVPVSTTAGVQGVVLADQLRNLDWRARRAEWIEEAQPKVVERLLKLLNTLLTS